MRQRDMLLTCARAGWENPRGQRLRVRAYSIRKRMKAGGEMTRKGFETAKAGRRGVPGQHPLYDVQPLSQIQLTIGTELLDGNAPRGNRRGGQCDRVEDQPETPRRGHEGWRTRVHVR